MDKNTLISSFGKWVSPINIQKLSEQVKELKQDYYTKKLTTEAYIKLLLVAQLLEFKSLEEMSDALVDEDLQKALGFESISASQLSRKNNQIQLTYLTFIHIKEVHFTSSAPQQLT
ncbi:DUF4372 domain-containing protein [Aeribacillus sp. FSL W8-0870]|uniref:DUF4372 domain-containing protein n=1 Tax=unclassified Aeribacillus TaxID=2640495 RepID=UPI0030CE4525